MVTVGLNKVAEPTWLSSLCLYMETNFDSEQLPGTLLTLGLPSKGRWLIWGWYQCQFGTEYLVCTSHFVNVGSKEQVEMIWLAHTCIFNNRLLLLTWFLYGGVKLLNQYGHHLFILNHNSFSQKHRNQLWLGAIAGHSTYPGSEL